jgi:hypothetical protein
MKALDHGLWTVGSEAHYARILSCRCVSVSVQQLENRNKSGPLWQTHAQTSSRALATAYSLQPAAWRSSR